MVGRASSNEPANTPNPVIVRMGVLLQPYIISSSPPSQRQEPMRDAHDLRELAGVHVGARAVRVRRELLRRHALHMGGLDGRGGGVPHLPAGMHDDLGLLA